MPRSIRLRLMRVDRYIYFKHCGSLKGSCYLVFSSIWLAAVTRSAVDGSWTNNEATRLGYLCNLISKHIYIYDIYRKSPFRFIECTLCVMQTKRLKEGLNMRGKMQWWFYHWITPGRDIYRQTYFSQLQEIRVLLYTTGVPSIWASGVANYLQKHAPKTIVCKSLLQVPFQ